MPAEIRHLIFSNPEVTSAIRNYCLRSGQLIPDDVTTRLEVGAENKPIVTISVEAGKHRRPVDLQVAGEKLLAALILFCHGKRIPLPVRGAKELCVLHGKLTVVIQLPMPHMLAKAS
ncbi:MAG: hypothetical protein JO255_07670 [Alphaproteobacteria bacterium]|nr:hypothetical protein [Alphaproteobacteria bacterium]